MSRTDEAEEWISELECRIVEIATIGQNIKRREWKEMKSLRHLRRNIEHTHVFIIGSHKKREKGPEKIFEEISAEKFPDMGK